MSGRCPWKNGDLISFFTKHLDLFFSYGTILLYELYELCKLSQCTTGGISDQMVKKN